MNPQIPLALGCILLLLVLGVPSGSATPAGIDLVISIDASGEVSMEGSVGVATLEEAEPGERYAWHLELENATTFELRYAPGAFDVERMNQVVPMLEDPAEDPATQYPLFYTFPHPRVWETDGPARIYHYFMDGETTVLRLQVPGPKEQVPGPQEWILSLERDLEPPRVAVGNVTEITRSSFYLETRTNEFALGDMQRRIAGGDGDWVENPTVTFDKWQRFHVQGLDAGTTYEVQPVFRDWAGNVRLLPAFNVTTLPPPAGPGPTFEVISPPEDARLASGSATPIEVRIIPDEDGLDPGSVRLFVDLKEVTEGWTLTDDVLLYVPWASYGDGPHVASVEARSLDGAHAHVRWTFHVGPEAEVAAPALLLALGAVIALVLAARRRA